jgi:hypothetical protein
MFKDQISPLFGFVVTWSGKTNRDCSISTVYLQVYNRNTMLWETLSSDSTTDAGSTITLSGGRFLGYTNYLNGSNEVAFRVYQQVK